MRCWIMNRLFAVIASHKHSFCLEVDLRDTSPDKNILVDPNAARRSLLVWKFTFCVSSSHWRMSLLRLKIPENIFRRSQAIARLHVKRKHAVHRWRAKQGLRELVQCARNLCSWHNDLFIFCLEPERAEQNKSTHFCRHRSLCDWRRRGITARTMYETQDQKTSRVDCLRI